MWCLIVWPYTCMSESSWASWVQAVGSILAIVGAFTVGHLQSRAVISYDRRRAANQLDGFARLFAVARGDIQMLASDGELFARASGRSDTEQLVRVKALQAAIERIPLEQLPGEAAMDSVLAVRTAIAELTRYIEENDQRHFEGGLARIDECLAVVVEHIGQMRREASRVLRDGPSHAAAGTD